MTRQWIRTTTKSMSLVTRRHRPREQPTSTFPDAPPVHRPVFIRSLIATRSLCLINPNNPFNVLNIAETKWRKGDADDDDDDDDVFRARKMEDPSRSRRDSRRLLEKNHDTSVSIIANLNQWVGLIVLLVVQSLFYQRVFTRIRLLREIVEFRRKRFDPSSKFCFRKILFYFISLFRWFEKL